MTAREHAERAAVASSLLRRSDGMDDAKALRLASIAQAHALTALALSATEPSGDDGINVWLSNPEDLS